MVLLLPLTGMALVWNLISSIALREDKIRGLLHGNALHEKEEKINIYNEMFKSKYNDEFI